MTDIKEGRKMDAVEIELNTATESVKIKEKNNFDLVKVQKEMHLPIANIKTDRKIDISSVRIKTEPGLEIDDSNASLPVHLLHQEAESFDTVRIKTEPGLVAKNMSRAVIHLNQEGDSLSTVRIKTEPGLDTDNRAVHSETESLETILLSVKQENDSESKANNGDVFVNIFTSETISAQTSELDLQNSMMENNSLDHINVEFINSELLSEQFLSTEIHRDINDSVDEITANESAPVQSVSIEPSKEKRSRKRNVSPECEVINLEEPQSTEQDEEYLPPKKKRGPKKKPETDDKLCKNFVCPFCDRPMSKTYFALHVRIHTGEKPHRCPKCCYATHFKGPLIFHMESHHPNDVHLVLKNKKGPNEMSNYKPN